MKAQSVMKKIKIKIFNIKNIIRGYFPVSRKKFNKEWIEMSIDIYEIKKDHHSEIEKLKRIIRDSKKEFKDFKYYARRELANQEERLRGSSISFINIYECFQKYNDKFENMKLLIDNLYNSIEKIRDLKSFNNFKNLTEKHLNKINEVLFKCENERKLLSQDNQLIMYEYKNAIDIHVRGAVAEITNAKKKN